MSRVASLMIIQPSYLPWLGFFEMLYRSDVFISYDTAQYTKNDWRNRNLIRSNTEKIWLTVPVQIKGKWPIPILDVKINNNTDWRRKHLRSLRQYYGRAPYFDQFFSPIEEEINKNYTYLQELNLSLVKRISDLLGFKRRIIKSSEMNLSWKSNKTSKLIAMCLAMGAKRYYASQASLSYIDKKQFSQAGIELVFQDYVHPIYRQQFKPFISHLSIIDLLFNMGPKSLKVILSSPSPIRDSSNLHLVKG